MAKKGLDKAGLTFGLQLLSLSMADTQRAVNRVIEQVTHCRDCARWSEAAHDCIRLEGDKVIRLRMEGYDYCSRALPRTLDKGERHGTETR